MTMEERIAKANEIHNAGGNCAQAVALAFSDLIDMDEKDLFKVMEGFGLGMGCMEGTCGAVSGAVAVTGLISSKGSLKEISKGNTYRLAGEIAKKFREKNSALTCRELKGIDTGKVLRPCAGCIEDAVRITSEVLSL